MSHEEKSRPSCFSTADHHMASYILRENDVTESESYGVGRDMWISLKLFLEA